MTSEGSRHEKAAELTTPSPAKLWVSGLVTTDTAGRVIGTLTRNRMRHRGLWLDTRSPPWARCNRKRERLSVTPPAHT